MLYVSLIYFRQKSGGSSSSGYKTVFTPEDGKVNLHIRSINYGEDTFESKYLMYHQKMKSTSVFLHDTTMVYAFPLLFFGHKLDVWGTRGTVVIQVSDHIKFRCEHSVANLIKVRSAMK